MHSIEKYKIVDDQNRERTDKKKAEEKLKKEEAMKKKHDDKEQIRKLSIILMLTCITK